MDYKKPQSTIVQGNVGIYPLTTADQVILADGSRLEKDGKISADSASDSSKLGGKAPEYYLQPRNLLDNSDFRNPVNQRGKTSVSNNGYFIDRWMIYSQNEANRVTSIDSNGLTTAGGSAVRQIVQAELVPKDVGEYTFAVCGSDGYIVFPDTWKDSNGNLICPISGAGTYIWAALYEGNYTAETLPPYVPKGYAAELAECQRYFVKMPVNDTLLYGNSGDAKGNSVRCYLPLPVSMRISPSVPSSIICSFSTHTGTKSNLTYTISLCKKITNGIAFYGSVSSPISSNPIYVNTVVQLRDTDLEISADL